jgi:hypothetical protein
VSYGEALFTHKKCDMLSRASLRPTNHDKILRYAMERTLYRTLELESNMEQHTYAYAAPLGDITADTLKHRDSYTNRTPSHEHLDHSLTHSITDGIDGPATACMMKSSYTRESPYVSRPAGLNTDMACL